MNRSAITRVVTIVCPALIISFAAISQPRKNAAIEIGNHSAVYDDKGMLLPWISWQDAVNLEMQWYLHCPITHGYPNFVWMTFMDGNYQPDARRSDFIPATQNGMGTSLT